VPRQQNRVRGFGVDADPVLEAPDRREEQVVRGVEVDVHPHARRHVTPDAIAPHGGRQLRLLAAVFRLVALGAGLPGRPVVRRLVGVVTGDTGERVALLEALTLAHGLRLVGHVIFLRVPADGRPVVLVQRLPRSVGERAVARLGGVAVALGADVGQPVAGERSGVDDRRGRTAGVDPVVLYVLPAGAVTPFAPDAVDEAVGAVPVRGAGGVLAPADVALQAARRHLAGEVALAVGGKGHVRPGILGVEVRHGEFVQSVATPGEEDFVEHPARPVDHPDPGSGPLFPLRRGPDGGLDVVHAGAGHLEPDSRLVALVEAAAVREPPRHEVRPRRDGGEGVARAPEVVHPLRVALAARLDPDVPRVCHDVRRQAGVVVG
jgi:hypothetical protein